MTNLPRSSVHGTSPQLEIRLQGTGSTREEGGAPGTQGSKGGSAKARVESRRRFIYYSREALETFLFRGKS